MADGPSRYKDNRSPKAPPGDPKYWKETSIGVFMADNNVGT